MDREIKFKPAINLEEGKRRGKVEFDKQYGIFQSIHLKIIHHDSFPAQVKFPEQKKHGKGDPIHVT